MIFLFFIFQFALAKVSTVVSTATPENILSQMTLDEKIDYVSGTGFATRAIPRLNVPALEMSDGPVGIRFGDGTAWPAGIALGATFNPQLAHEVGVALGEEARAFDKRLLLGPMVNIARTPWGGRVFESFGEDPYLSSEMAKSYIVGLQSQGVGACIKHFAVNNQESFRSGYNANVSERALQEIYFPAFKSAVDAGSISIMAAYNKVNGAFASENTHLIQEVLKRDWNFDGFILSDWGATHSTIPAALAGLDLEMPVADFFSSNLKQAVLDGKVPLSNINDKVLRILRALDKLKMLNPSSQIQQAKKEHPDLSLQVAKESLVLLKNKNNILPLPLSKPIKIALLGPSVSRARTGGGGSSYVTPSNAVTALEGLKNRIDQLKAPIELLVDDEQFLPGDSLPHPPLFSNFNGEKWISGLVGEYFANQNLEGTAAYTEVDDAIEFNWGWDSPNYDLISADHFSARWTGKFAARVEGLHEFVLTHNDGARLYIDNILVIDHWQEDPNHPLNEDHLVVNLKANETHDFKLEFYDDEGLAYLQLGIIEPGTLTQKSVELAKNADYAIVFVGNSTKIESESYDRSTLRLTSDQEQLIKNVARSNPNTLVVLQAGSAVEMNEWLGDVKGLIMAWYPGDQGGYAIADALLGQFAPSGRLPLTFPKQWSDSSAAATYPGANGQVDYSDDIFVGYRYFEKNNIEPLFRFGYGLSYSTFSSQIISASRHIVEVEVKNLGPYDSNYVVPLYVSDLSPKVQKAVRELKALESIYLKAGETKTVSLTLGDSAFRYFNPQKNKWQIDRGQYKIELLSNEARPVDSADIFVK